MAKREKKKLPLVSVVINCFNGEKYLDDAIKSVIQQNYKNWELIFFDNNSKDKSNLIVKKYREKRIKYFKSNKTHTLYKARNLALQKCKGEFICFLDVDDWWQKNKIKKQVNIFLRNQKIDLVFSNLFIFDQLKKKQKLLIKNRFNEKITSQKLINKFEMPILTTMIRKKVFKFNKFNSLYTIIGDFDFFVRISINHNIKYLHEPLAYYRMHNLNLTNKKVDLNIKELINWLNLIKKKKLFKNLNFEVIKSKIELLTIKKNIILKKRFKAVKLIFKKPIKLLKLKYLFLLFYKF